MVRGAASAAHDPHAVVERLYADLFASSKLEKTAGIGARRLLFSGGGGFAGLGYFCDRL